MSVLSAQSIRRLCIPGDHEDRKHCRYSWDTPERHYELQIWRALAAEQPLITPFTERGVVNGKSYGLSACTYDCRIDQDLVLEPMPWHAIAMFIACGTMENGRERGLHAANIGTGKYRALASTRERFCIPRNVCGSVLDKSSYARVFVSAFNTHLDPGWDGFLTVELVNLGPDVVTYAKGDPVCQVKFEWLDEPTDLPYVGRKYSDQPARPVAAISEDG